MVTSSYSMVEDYSPISHLPSHQSSHLPLHQSSHLPTHCRSQSRGYISHSPDYISHSPAYISHTPSSSSCKRKLPNEYDSYPERPPKHRVFSMLHNTPKQHRNESKQMLRMAIKKLRAIDNPETNLCRSVLINNTVKRLRDDIKEEKRNGFLKTKLSQHYSMDYESDRTSDNCDRTGDNCDKTSDNCDRTSDVSERLYEAKYSSKSVSDSPDAEVNDAVTVSCDSTSRQEDDDNYSCNSISDLIYRPTASQSASQTMSYSTYHSTSHYSSHLSLHTLPTSHSTPHPTHSTSLSHTVSDFAHIVQDCPQPKPESGRCPGYDVTKDTMMSYPEPIVMDTSDSEEFIDIMTVDDENTPLDLSVTNKRTYETPDKHAPFDMTSFAERVSVERLESRSCLNKSHAEQQGHIAKNESLLTDRDRLILSDMEAVFNKIMNVITDSCHGANLSHEIPTFMSEIPTITSSS